MGSEDLAEMVEEGDLDDKLEDKATNEVVDDVKKVAMEEKKQVAMKVANTNCLDDLIDDALLLLFLLLDCRICMILQRIIRMQSRQ